jgi:type III restriction enzyme
METKDYQRRVLEHVEDWLKKLNEQNENKENALAALSNAGVAVDIPFDVPQRAWEALNMRKPYQPWKNGLNEDTPLVCLKVPTGGGKTYLAARCIELINLHYRRDRFAMVLWIVPSTQIYNDTLKALRNREHFYRQILDRLSGGRTLIFEKADRFTPQQVRENLIVLLLMLPSANKQDKETLKIFQDNTKFDAFFPNETNIGEQMDLLTRFRNLDHYGNKEDWAGVSVKTSLGNTLRIQQPLIILDEGHKSYSDLARETLRSFNPCFVLELSATPRMESNILVEVTGQELNREEMIKLNLNIFSTTNPGWQATLLDGFHRIQMLDQSAHEFHGNSGRYIRPVCLIQVERTGAKQDTGNLIHANDARRYLIEQCSVDPDKIAIQSAENDGLKGVDLFSPECKIQYIITKSALQEGWDCSFAYVLVVLTAATAVTGLTQLIGRILRQPDAKKTGIKVLDESYVYCLQSSTKEVLAAIRKGFEEEGLGDLRHHTRQTTTTDEGAMIDVRYREHFRHFESKIYLPRFVVQEAEGFRPLSYDMDLARYVNWKTIDVSGVHTLALNIMPDETRQTSVTIADDPGKVLEQHATEAHNILVDLDPFFMVRQISDLVPNAWVAYRLVRETLDFFEQRYDQTRISANIVLIIKELKRNLNEQIITHAEQIFRDRLNNREIIFFLEKTTAYDYVLPSTVQINGNRKKLVRDNNDPIQYSLFEYQPEDEFNELEKSVAIFLDKQGALLWWYRNLVGPGAYKIQGWRREAIYADFVTAHRDPDVDGDYSKIYVLETKGLHLKGNADTEYKGSIFDLCNELGQQVDWATLGQDFPKRQVEFQIVYEDEWKNKINQLFT